MASEFKLPQLAEGIESADVAELHVKAGDTVEEGQVLMELETDKAVMELPAPQAGKIGALKVKKGDTVKVGQVVLTFDGAESSTSNGAAEPAAKETKSEKTESATAPARATTVPEPVAARASAPAPSSSGLPIAAGPATRRLARELGIRLDSLTGTGSGGRITAEDVARAFAGTNGGSGGGGIAVPALPDFSQFGSVERQAFTKLQKTAANNLSMAWQVIPHVTQHDLVDVTDLEAARKRFVEQLGKNGPKVTMTAIAIKAVVRCLKEFPQFNSSYDSKSAELVLKQYYHVGVAVDTPNGLVVPVLRDADKKTILQIAAELGEIAEKARARKLEPKDMMGGTFTITNLGGIGGTAFTPIVNWPEVAILGMSRSQKQLQLDGEELTTRLMLPLSLSYDHRVVNGADAARFIVKLGSLFSDPFRLLTEC
jgi:pyruvate dehydrogenase E2 component (dihydrolipoamide acetyltransferase)